VSDELVVLGFMREKNLEVNVKKISEDFLMA